MMDKIKKILNEVERLCNAGLHNSTISKKDILNTILAVVNDFKEEPVSEKLNIESMIESYKQRLISQANGVKNSPFISMCLVSYKHGINEVLDTLNLSNVQRTTKNWKEPKFKVGDRIKFKGVQNEDVTRVIINIQKSDGGGFRYLFADGSIYSIGDDGIELVEEPVSEDLEEAAMMHYKDVMERKITTALETANMTSFKAGANWQKEQMMAKAVDGYVIEDIEEGNGDFLLDAEYLPKNMGLKDRQKVKVIVIKED